MLVWLVCHNYFDNQILTLETLLNVMYCVDRPNKQVIGIPERTLFIGRLHMDTNEGIISKLNLLYCSEPS